MSDDKMNRNFPDNVLISLTQDYEVRYWTKALGVTHSELAEAIKIVGASSSKVRTYLEQVQNGA